MMAGSESLCPVMRMGLDGRHICLQLKLDLQYSFLHWNTVDLVLQLSQNIM